MVVLAGAGVLAWAVTSDDPEVESVADVAGLAGCGEYDVVEDALVITEAGTCTVDGVEVRLAYFADGDVVDDWAQLNGRLGSRALVGDHWAIAADDVELLERIREDAGGEVRP